MANERRDYLVAFLIGAVVGVAAAVLLNPPEKKRPLRALPARMRRLRKRGRLRRLIPGR
jgi:hypothetical protein